MAFTNEWVRAFLLALVPPIVLHSFVLRWGDIVESTSMFATLHPGDLVLCNVGLVDRTFPR
ncbi:MAG: S26 family signal peptidase [Flavobacteriales bacterium]|nr:S26 family signal peptidase [Flavobacteriales bacterium]